METLFFVSMKLSTRHSIQYPFQEIAVDIFISQLQIEREEC